MAAPFFQIWTSQLQLPQKRTCNCNDSPPSPCHQNTSPGKTCTQISVTSFLSMSKITTGKITDYHKARLLIACYKLEFLSHLIPSCNYKFYTPPTPHLQSTYYISRCLQKMWREPFHPLGYAESLKTISPLCSLNWHQKQKDEILDSLCISHPWIKPEASHLPTWPPCPLFNLNLSHLPKLTTIPTKHSKTKTLGLLPPHIGF